MGTAAISAAGVERIRRQHEVFRSTLQISLAVLATARETLQPKMAAMFSRLA